jgi:hypothetical protein
LPVTRDDYGKGCWGDCQFDADAVAVSETCGRSIVLEPVTAALAGISLVKASVDFIKQNINTAKDIGEIAGQIDALFTGQKQVQEASNRKSGVGLADQFGVQSVAKEMIDAKLAAEQIAEVAQNGRLPVRSAALGLRYWQNVQNGCKKPKKRVQGLESWNSNASKR